MLESLRNLRRRLLHANSGSDLVRIQQLLRNAAEDLARLSNEVGTPLLQAAELLPQFSEASDKLIQESELLLQLATGQKGGQAVVSDTAELLQAPLEYLASWRTEMTAHEDALRICADILSGMLGAEQNLQAIVSPLRHMQTMFRIESASLQEETRQIFAGLTEKIESVHRRVQETFVQQFQIVAQNDVAVRHVLDGLHAENERLQTMISSHRADMEASLSRLEQEIAHNMTRDVQLRDVSKLIFNEVCGIVVALQSQDIVSQRLEHIKAALRELRGASTLPADAGIRLQLQAAQTEGVHKDIRATHEALAEAVRRIFGAVDNVDDKCLRLSEFEEVTAAATGTVQVLLDTIANARSLTTTTVEIANDSAERIRPVAATASGLIGALETLAIEMHLIALNAQIQAVQIGERTGLEVLAAHTAGVSRATEAMVRKVADDVGRLAEHLSTINTALDKLGIEGSGHLSVLQTGGGVQEQTLHGFRDETLSRLRNVGSTADTIRKITAALQDHAEQVAATLQPMQELIEQLRSAAVLVPASNTSGPSMPSVAATYTMESERQVHQQILASEPASTPEAPEAGCEVELF